MKSVAVYALKADLEMHMAKEEQTLFPMIPLVDQRPYDAARSLQHVAGTVAPALRQRLVVASGQVAAQQTARPAQPRHHGADGDVEDLGGVGVAELADVDEHDHVAEVVG